MTMMKKSAGATARKKQEASLAEGVLDPPKKTAQSMYEIIAPSQLRQADQMLTRIERKGRELSASAEKLLRRVS
jgi:hypothetical protein